jgi:hypothetical protein
MNILQFGHSVSEDLLRILKQKALAGSYHSYVTLKGNKIGLEWADGNDVDATEILNLVPFKHNSQTFTRFLASTYIDPHTDDSLRRTSCISVALIPDLEDFAPVLYYDKLGSDATIVQTYHYTRHPVIINTSNVHAMYNNAHDRYMFQISYSEDISAFLPYI